MFIRKLSISSYRTLLNVDIEFNSLYTAICGKNNSGKSNIVRAIRALLGFPGPFDQGNIRLSRSDRTAWEDGNENPRIKMQLELDREKDGELLQFIQRLTGDENAKGPKQTDEDKATASDKSHTTHIEISATLEGDNNREKVAIRFEDTLLDDYATQEVMRKIRSSNCYIFHNSTTTPPLSMRYQEDSVADILARLSSENTEKLRAKRKAFFNEMDRAMLSHSARISELLGRLSDKYDVKIAIHEKFIDYLPFDISLGYRDKALSIPLDDWGSGTRNRTLILQKLITAHQSSESDTKSGRLLPIVLLEEPESFLHPPAQAEFGNVLQDLAEEFGVQVIATSHSPYMLSHKDASANILLRRKEKTRKSKDGERRKIRETYIVDTNGENWRQPFELALGTCGPEFEYLREAIFANSDEIILVEGKIDKGYLSLLMDDTHGKNRLKLAGSTESIVPYDGIGALKNGALVRFIKDRFAKLIVTCDLDYREQVLKDLAKCDITEFDGFVAIGIDSPGCRCIEGLVPQRIKNTVRTRNPDLIDAISSDNSKEAKDAKNKVKQRYLDEFQASARVEEGDFRLFYALTERLNQALGRG